MNSNHNHSQKSSKMFHSSRHQLNHSSETQLDKYKRDSNGSFRPNKTIKSGTKFRLKTQSREVDKSLESQGRNKTHSLLLPQKQLTLKEAKISKLFDSSFVKTEKQQLLNTSNNVNTKTQSEWVNSVLPTLSAEALYQQNHQLKKQINQLKQENSRLLSKLNMEKKEKQKLAKQLSLQNDYYNFYERFDIFCNNNVQQKTSRSKSKHHQINNKYGFHPVNYMITGIKFRYEKLKADYELKCKELEEVLKLIQFTDLSEIIQQNKMLEKDNSRLVTKITQLSSLFFDQKEKNQLSPKTSNDQYCFKSNKFLKINTENSNSSLTESKIQEINSEYVKSLIQAKHELTQENYKLAQSNAHLQSRIKEITEEMRQKTASIKNMHKSLTLLDNELYHQKKQNKHLLKIQKETDAKFASLQKQNVKIKFDAQKEIQNRKSLTEKMFEAQKKIFMKQIQQKNQKIAKIQKEVSYLSALLKYWRPLEQDEPSLRHKESSKPQNYDQEQSNALRSSMRITPTRKRTKTKISQNEKSVEDIKLGLKDPVLSVNQSLIQNDEIVSEDQQNEERTPKTSRRKHENGFRARKVNPLEIEFLKDQIKYRCMARRLSMQQIKQFFKAKPQRLQKQSQKQQNWKQRYVTMKQLKEILIEIPFCLTKDEAYKFSRFIVEDTSAENVYCDQENEIEREIVKSIIKAFIGEYQLSDLEKCKTQLKKLLIQYGVNLRRALDALSDRGQIATQKFFGLIDSLGIGMTDELKCQIMVRLYQRSESRSLTTLKYGPIFEDNFI